MRTKEGREGFAHAVSLFGSCCFIGATAGMRHALEVGDLLNQDLAAMRALLPGGCELRVLSPLEEARYELHAMRRHCEPSDGMLSMGGKSMQIACGDAVYSLPFAMHFGSAILREEGSPWLERVDRCSREYQTLVAQERERQSLQLQGTFVCVTDTVIVGKELELLDRYIASCELLEILSTRAKALRQCFEDRDVVHAARVLLMHAVISGLFAESRFIFRSDFEVSWTSGYFSMHGQEQ